MTTKNKKYDEADYDPCFIPLDNLTAIWLARLEMVSGTPAGEIIASMLYSIRIDDERTNGPLETHH